MGRSVGSDLFGNGHPKGKSKVQVTSADDVTDYMVWGGKRILERLKGEDKESRDVMTIPTMPQFRKIRRIIGEYELDVKMLQSELKEAGVKIQY